MSDIQAALGLAQLPKLETFWGRRRAITKAYDDAFASIPEIGRLEVKDGVRSSYHLYVSCCAPSACHARETRFWTPCNWKISVSGSTSVGCTCTPTTAIGSASSPAGSPPPSTRRIGCYRCRSIPAWTTRRSMTRSRRSARSSSDLGPSARWAHDADRLLGSARLHRQGRVGGPLRERRVVDRHPVVAQQGEYERIAAGRDAAAAVGDHAPSRERSRLGESPP